MTFNLSRTRMLNGAALGMCSAFVALFFAGAASAQSVCTVNTVPSPDTFACTNGAATPVTATGTASDGAVQTPTTEGLSLTSTAPLTVTLSGQILTAGPAASAVALISSLAPGGGALAYTSTGTTMTSGTAANTRLTGHTVTATTGTVVASGANSIGVLSTSIAGANTTTGGTTTLANAANLTAIGIQSVANGGTNVTNTGVITVNGTGPGNVGVLAITSPWGASVCGNNIVNVTGNVTVTNGTGISTDSCGASIVTVDATRTVATTTGTGIVNGATSTAFTNIAGTVDSGVANVAINANGRVSNTRIAASGSVVGRFDGTDGEDVFTNQGTITTSGISDFRGSFNVITDNASGLGPDVFNNGGTLITTGATTFAGLETFTNFPAGTLVLAPAIFSLPATSFSFINAGTIRAEGGATTVASLATLANSGTIDLQDGAVDDLLTITNNYSGSGAARLLLDISDAGSDRLVIGGAASGSTVISLTAAGGTPINAAGFLLVDAGTATTGVFILNDNVSTGLINVVLEQRGADFFLVSTPDVVAFQPLALANVAKYLWYQSADIYTGYTALRRGDLATKRGDGIGFWAQLYAGRDKSGEDETVTAFGGTFDVDNRIKTSRRGAQTGIDFQSFGGSIVVGVTAGYQRAEADFRSATGGFTVEGHNAGLYAIAGMATGIYGGLLFKVDRNDVENEHVAFDNADANPDFKSRGFEGEVGYRFGMSGLDLDVGAGLASVTTKIDGFNAEDIGFDFDDSKSLRGRVGARVGFGGDFGPYLEGKLFREFKDDARLTFTNGTQVADVHTMGRRTWGRIEAGVGCHGGAGPIAAVWGEFGDVKGIGAKAGFRF